MWDSKKLAGFLGKHSFLFLYLLFAFFPVYWLAITALKPLEDVQAWPPQFIPTRPTFEFLISIIIRKPFGRWIINSVFLATTVMLISLAVGSLAAYGFSRRFKHSEKLFVSVLVSRMMPPIALVVPMVMGALKLNIMDSMWALILAHIFVVMPFTIWILRPYYDAIPEEIYESALIDGCSKPRAFFWILLPLTRPGLLGAGILAFMDSWKDLLWALVLTSHETVIITNGLFKIQGEDFIVWNEVCAASLYTILPAFLLVWFLQKYIIRGIVAGAVKE